MLTYRIGWKHDAAEHLISGSLSRESKKPAFGGVNFICSPLDFERGKKILNASMEGFQQPIGITESAHILAAIHVTEYGLLSRLNYNAVSRFGRSQLRIGLLLQAIQSSYPIQEFRSDER